MAYGYDFRAFTHAQSTKFTPLVNSSVRKWELSRHSGEVRATSRPRFAVPAPHFALGEWHWVTYHMDGSVDARRGDHRLRYLEQLRLCGSVYVDRARSGRPGRWSITTSRWALAVDKFKVVVCWGQ
jgi:hypothetical protein